MKTTLSIWEERSATSQLSVCWPGGSVGLPWAPGPTGGKEWVCVNPLSPISADLPRGGRSPGGSGLQERQRTDSGLDVNLHWSSTGGAIPKQEDLRTKDKTLGRNHTECLAPPLDPDWNQSHSRRTKECGRSLELPDGTRYGLRYKDKGLQCSDPTPNASAHLVAPELPWAALPPAESALNNLPARAPRLFRLVHLNQPWSPWGTITSGQELRHTGPKSRLPGFKSWLWP